MKVIHIINNLATGGVDGSPVQLEQVKLLFLTASLNVGGTERVIARLCNTLDSRKYNMSVVSLRQGSGSLVELLPASIRVVNLGASSRIDVQAVSKLVRLLQTEQVDIIYTFLFHAGLLGRIVGRLVHVPIILCSERNVISRDRSLRKLALRWTWRLADHFICPSEAVRDYLHRDCGADRGRISIIYNGVDLDEFPYVERHWDNLHDPVVGCVANLEPKKGYDDWLEAADIMSRSLPRVRFKIIGDGIERDRLQALVRSKALSDRVELLGYRTDVAVQLARMHIYVQSSLYEGMPNAVIEAMATGLPVVATSVGGTPELVIDGVTGFLAPPHRPDVLADKTLSLLQNPGIAKQMGHAGRKRVETHFSLERMVCETDAVLQRFLREKRRPEYAHNVG
jgi:glycosyltransferase involved in cell wall biosynthesis